MGRSQLVGDQQTDHREQKIFLNRTDGGDQLAGALVEIVAKTTDLGFLPIVTGDRILVAGDGERDLSQGSLLQDTGQIRHRLVQAHRGGARHLLESGATRPERGKLFEVGGRNRFARLRGPFGDGGVEPVERGVEPAQSGFGPGKFVYRERFQAIIAMFAERTLRIIPEPSNVNLRCRRAVTLPPLPIVICYDRAQAYAAIAAAEALDRPIRVETPGEMAAALRPAWLRGFFEACSADGITPPAQVAFHCGDAPGLVLAGLSIGLAALRFEPAPDANPHAAEALAAIAAAQGCDLAVGPPLDPAWRFPPPSGSPDPRVLTNAVRRWLSSLPSAEEFD